MIKVLHLSDIHLNSGYANKSEKVRRQLKSHLKLSFSNAIDYAITQLCDVLMVVGDLFDHDKIAYEDEQFIIGEFKRALNAGIHVAYCSGNHDPLGTFPFVSKLSGYDNLHMFLDDQVRIDNVHSRDNTPFELVSVGHQSKAEKRDLIRLFPKKDGFIPRIGMAHASVPSALTTSDKVAYMATPLNTIESLNYDYFALGHIHIRQLLTDKIGYSGNIQGLNIKETGNKGGYWIEIERGITRVSPVDFNSLSWFQIGYTITAEIQSIEALKAAIIDHIHEQLKDVGQVKLVRVLLTGKTPLIEELNTINLEFLEQDLLERLDLLYLELDSSKVEAYISEEMLKQEHTVVSELLHFLDAEDYPEALLERLSQLPGFSSYKQKQQMIEALNGINHEVKTLLVNRMVVSKDEN